MAQAWRLSVVDKEKNWGLHAHRTHTQRQGSGRVRQPNDLFVPVHSQTGALLLDKGATHGKALEGQRGK